VVKCNCFSILIQEFLLLFFQVWTLELQSLLLGSGICLAWPYDSGAIRERSSKDLEDDLLRVVGEIKAMHNDF
jgi:hypothetical protein